jgi:endonuclease III related protein
MILGAILTQNTSWSNVEKAIRNLRDHELISLESLCRIDIDELASLVRSSGYFNQKAQRLKSFCLHIRENWEGDLTWFLSQEMEALRIELLSMRGIGPETADSIILYAACQPSFVVDAYTFRIFSRHGWIEETANYESLRSFFMDALEADVALYQEYHALLVNTGKFYCRRKPLCTACPLHDCSKE